MQEAKRARLEQQALSGGTREGSGDPELGNERSVRGELIFIFLTIKVIYQ